MALGLPFEIVTLLGAGLMGGLMQAWGMSLKAKKEQHMMLLEKAGIVSERWKDARQYENKGFQYTRRTIALIAVFAIIVLPKVVAMLKPELGVTVGWTEFHPGFLFFPGKDVTVWKEVSGLAITPLDTHLVVAIVGLYFGGSTVRNS